MNLTDQNVVERFWKYVDRQGDDECWNWTGAKLESGYGRLKVGFRAKNATHISYAIANGEMPDGKIICHTCDNPSCVNPAHLFAGTQLDNIRDMHAKGRVGDVGAKGEANGRAKLNQAKADEIREIFSAGGISVSEIARRYGVSRSAINLILNGKHWNYSVDA